MHSSSIFNVFFENLSNGIFEKLPVADSQVYERRVEAFFDVFMQIKNELLPISCGIIQVFRMQRIIQPQVLTSSGLFLLVFS